jgi:hypothetical protein
MATTRDELMKLHEELCENARQLSRRKNHDYSGGKDTSQAFLNFVKCEELGFCRTETGVLVRMSDKLSRLKTLADSNLKYEVEDEKVLDTILDIINYAVIFYGIHQERKSKEASGGAFLE